MENGERTWYFWIIITTVGKKGKIWPEGEESLCCKLNQGL